MGVQYFITGKEKKIIFVEILLCVKVYESAILCLQGIWYYLQIKNK